MTVLLSLWIGLQFYWWVPYEFQIVRLKLSISFLEKIFMVILINRVMTWDLFSFEHDSIYSTPHTEHSLFHLIRLYNQNITFKVIGQLISGFNFYPIYFHSVEILKINIFESLASNLPAHSNEYMPYMSQPVLFKSIVRESYSWRNKFRQRIN